LLVIHSVSLPDPWGCGGSIRQDLLELALAARDA
jgi:hypothetical protein